MSDFSFKSNVLYLGLIQGLNYIIPLLTFPYLTRVLGLEAFGNYSYTAAIIAYSTLIINFGFDMSSTVTFSKLRENNTPIAPNASAVYLIKACLLMVNFLAMTVIFLMEGIDDIRYMLLLCYSPLLIGRVFSSVYIFQAFGLLKQMSIINIISRVLPLPLVFILVDSPSDIYVACLLQSIPVFVSSLLSVIYLRKCNIRLFSKFDIKTLRSSLYDGFLLFKLSCATSVYSNSIPVLIGLFSNVEYVGLYNVANTIKQAILGVFSVAFKAMFPKVTNLLSKNNMSEARRFLYKTTQIIIPFVVLLALFVSLYSEGIIDLVSGVEYISSAEILKVLMVALVFSILNNFLGVQTLVPLGLKKEFSSAVVKSSLLVIPCVVFFIIKLGAIGGAYSVVLAEVIIFYMLFKIHRINRLNVLPLVNKY